MKIFRTILVGIIGAAAFAFGGAAVLSLVGLTVTNTLSFYLVAAGFVVGALASELESSLLYGIIAAMILVSMFSILFANALPGDLWVTKILLKVAGSSGWTAYAVWFGVHVALALLFAQWIADPSLTVGEAVGKTVALIGSVVGDVTTGIAGGILVAIGAFLSTPTGLIIAGVAVWYLARGRFGAAGRVFGSARAREPEFTQASFSPSIDRRDVILEPQPSNPRPITDADFS